MPTMNTDVTMCKKTSYYVLYVLKEKKTIKENMNTVSGPDFRAQRNTIDCIPELKLNSDPKHSSIKLSLHFFK